MKNFKRLRSFAATFLLFFLLSQSIGLAFAEELASDAVGSNQAISQKTNSESSKQAREITGDIGVTDTTLQDNDSQSKEMESDEAVTTKEKLQADQSKKIDPKLSNLASTNTTDPHIAPSVVDPYESAKKVLPKADESSGSLIFSYSFSEPAGRNNLTPNLTLIYNSQGFRDMASLLGAGWSLNIPSIERENKKGTQRLYDDNYFSSSLSGELVGTQDPSIFAAKTESGDFLNYKFSQNYWTVTDKSGNVYKFGDSTATRQDDPDNTTHVSKWLLSEKRDSNNNFIKYEYSKEGGEIYPSKITYTGNGAQDGIFSINFLYENRPDVHTSWSTGFKVDTTKRTSSIEIKNGNQLVSKYQFNYIVGGNGSKPLLESITKTGYDSQGVATALPPMGFNYKSSSTKGWTLDNSWQLPVATQYYLDDTFYQVDDVNGDGLSDIFKRVNRDDVDVNQVFLNNGHSWTLDDSWQLPVATQYYNEDTKYKVLDLNGDHLPDIFKRVNKDNIDVNLVFMNNGHGWAQDDTWQLPIPTQYYNDDLLIKIIDINGDDLPDFFISSSNSSGSGQLVFLNNGHGWTQDENWIIPVTLRYYGQDTKYKIVDINGDGLPDIFKRVNEDNVNNQEVFLNNGHGWVLDNSWPVPFATQYYRDDQQWKIADINGDGLADFFLSVNNEVNVSNYVYINNGHGWTLDTNWVVPVQTRYYNQDTKYKIADVNGDGLPDIFKRVNQDTLDTQEVFINSLNGGLADDLLTSINYPTGGKTEISYQPSAVSKDGNGNLTNTVPFSTYTVSQIKNLDGQGLIQIENFSYQKGKYYYSDPYNKKFSGFGLFEKSDSVGNKTKIYSHQGNDSDVLSGEYQDNYFKMGKVYKTENYDNTGKLYSVQLDKWGSQDLGNQNAFVFLDQSVKQSYDGTNSHKDSAESYTYNQSNGNIEQKVEWGEVNGNTDGSFTDLGNDKFITSYTYANGGTSFAPSSQSVTDQTGNVVKETKYYYDNLPLGQLDKGNLTKQEDLKSSGVYANTQKTYNSFGLVTQTKDANGNATNITYDSYNLYPSSVTNALNHKENFIYDASIGKVTDYKDQNANNFKNTYDGLGRPLLVKVPDANSTSTLLTKTSFVYSDVPNAVSVTQTDYLSATTTVVTVTYFDGLSRKIQTRKSFDNSGNFQVVDFIYDSRGNVVKQSLPYLSVGAAKTPATSSNELYINYIYDALGRTVSDSSAVGTNIKVYSPWKVVATDANNNSKDLYYDAYGNLIQVGEHNGASTYSTNYIYDYNHGLTKLTDALNNVRNFSYNLLGQRISAQDLHSQTDTVFGTYTYNYDNAGNLIETITPNGYSVKNTYDALNRPLVQSTALLPSTIYGTQITNTYDTCKKGLICKSQYGSNYTSYVYDGIGRISQLSKYLDAKTYTEKYKYNWQDQQTELNNGLHTFTYDYSPFGQISAVKMNGQTIANNITYAPTGNIAEINFANGAKTTNTYDSNKLYRLINKTTTASSTAVQSTGYTYDSVGNILNLTELANNQLQKTVDFGYDSLYRLTSATASSTQSSPFTQTYSYDALGNILNKSDVGNYLYNAAPTAYNNPHAATKAGLINLTYDKNGNITAMDDSVTSQINNPLWLSGFTTYKFRKKISVPPQNTQSTSTAPAMLLKISDPEFKSVTYGGKVAKDNGLDFVFTDGTGGLRQYFVLEKYDPQTGDMWLRYTPNMASTTATSTLDSYLYFGYASASTNYQSVSGVWGSMRLLYNLNDNLIATTTVTDLGAYKYNGALSASLNASDTVSSLLGKGLNFSGIDSIKLLASSTNVSNLTNTTVSLWVNPTYPTPTSTAQVLIDKMATSTTAGWKLSLNPDMSVELIQNYTTGKVRLQTNAGVVSSTTATNIVINFGASATPLAANFKIYINGAEATYSVSQNGTGSRPTDANNPLVIGNCFASTCGYYGLLDDVWVYGTLLKPEQISNVYKLNNISSSQVVISPAEAYGTNTVTNRKIANTFDYRNLITKTVNGTKTVNNYYDSKGDRFKQLLQTGTTTTSTIYYPFDSYNKNISGTTTTETEHVFLGNLMLATIVTSSSTTKIYYQHPDYLGGASVVTDQQGNISELTDYFPFGEVKQDIKLGTLNEQRKYIGEEYDEDSKLNYLNARFYDSKIGKFMGEDPAFVSLGHIKLQLLDPQSWNSYSYSRNNPIALLDKTGKFPTPDKWIAAVGNPIVNWQLNQIRSGHEFLAGFQLGFGSAAAIEAAPVVTTLALEGTQSAALSTVTWGLGNPQAAITIGAGVAESLGSRYISDKINGESSPASAYVVDGLFGIATGYAGQKKPQNSALYSGMGSMGASVTNDIIQGQDINWGQALISGGLDAGYTYAADSAPQVRGRIATSYSTAIVSKRSQRVYADSVLHMGLTVTSNVMTHDALSVQSSDEEDKK